MAGKFELYKDKGGEFRFRLKASNGQSILASEGYSSKPSALNGIESIRKNASDSARFETRESSSGKSYFVLKAGNSQIIGQGEMYESPAACKAGIESVMKNAPDADTDDQS